MQQAEFDSVFITVTHRPPSGVFSTTQYTAADFRFEASAGSVRVFSLAQPDKGFIQYGPGQWWGTGHVVPERPEQKNKPR